MGWNVNSQSPDSPFEDNTLIVKAEETIKKETKVSIFQNNFAILSIKE